MSTGTLLTLSQPHGTRPAGRDLAMLVADIAILADGLLMHAGAPLMTVSLTGGAPVRPMTIWNERLETCRRGTAALYAATITSPGMAALHAAAASLSHHFVAVDRADGPWSLVTDGTGIAIVPDAPGHDAAWLLSAAGEAIVLRPFAEAGIWELLCVECDFPAWPHAT